MVGRTKEKKTRRQDKLLPGYWKCDKEVILYSSRRNTLGKLFPDSIVRVKKFKKDMAYIDWPIFNAWIKVRNLSKRILHANEVKLMPLKEDMVNTLSGYWSELHISGRTIVFLRRFFQVCKQTKIIDLSYCPGSPIAKFFEQPRGCSDFRKFRIPRINRLGIFINLPWYFKFSLVKKIKELLEEAKKRKIILDIVVIQSNHNKRSKWFSQLRELCYHHWIIRDNFRLPKGQAIWCGPFFCGYCTTRDRHEAMAIKKKAPKNIRKKLRKPLR